MTTRPGQAKDQATKTTLTRDDLILISNVLYNSRWTGQEWNERISPLINKLAAMIDELSQPNDG